MKNAELIETAEPLNPADILLKNPVSDRRQAQLMYWAGYIVTQIARQLNIPVSTIASWKSRDQWDKTAPEAQIEVSLHARINLLLMKDDKSGKDFKEIDLLFREC